MFKMAFGHAVVGRAVVSFDGNMPGN